MLRSILHQSLHFRPPLHAASFSSALVRKHKVYDNLVGILEDQSRRAEVEEEDDDDERPAFTRVISEGGQDGSYGTYKERIRGFLRNRPLHPTEFSRARRVVTPRIIPKKWDLGLPTRRARFNDIFYQLGIDPVDECMNGALLSHFVTRMGRVQTRAETRLTMKSQRRVAKAIKRAKMMGILPIHSKSSGLLRLG